MASAIATPADFGDGDGLGGVSGGKPPEKRPIEAMADDLDGGKAATAEVNVIDFYLTSDEPGDDVYFAVYPYGYLY